MKQYDNQVSLARLAACDCRTCGGTPRIPLSVIVKSAVPVGLWGDFTKVHVRTSSMDAVVLDDGASK
jgi:hypothetical protein